MVEDYDTSGTAPRSSTPSREDHTGDESLSFIPVQDIRDLNPSDGVVDQERSQLAASATSTSLPVEDVIPTFNRILLEMQQMQPTVSQMVSERGTLLLKNGKRVGKDYVESLEVAMAAMEERLKEAEEENERLNAELVQKKAEQESQTITYNNHLCKLRASLQQSTRDAEGLGSKVIKLESQLLPLKTENQKLTESNNELIVEVKDLRAFKDNGVDLMISRAEERFKDQISDLEKECSNYRSINLSLRSKLSASERNKDKLQLLYDTTQQRRQSLNMGLPSSLSSPTTSSSSQSETQGYPPRGGGVPMITGSGDLITQIHEMNGTNAR